MRSATLEKLTDSDIEALEKALAARPTKQYEAIVDAETIRVRAAMRTFLEDIETDIKKVSFHELVMATSDLAVDVMEPAAISAAASAAETWNLPPSAARTATSLAPQAAAETINSEQVARNIRWALSPLVDDALDPVAAFRKAVSQTQDTTGRRVQGAAREAGLVVAQREGNRIRAVSIPRGPTCPWCLTMATRADLKHSKSRDVWHPNCDCSIELTAMGAKPAGINLLAADLYSDSEKWAELTKWINDKTNIAEDHDWTSN